jgi:hypothetical protein
VIVGAVRTAALVDRQPVRLLSASKHSVTHTVARPRKQPSGAGADRDACSSSVGTALSASTATPGFPRRTGSDAGRAPASEARPCAGSCSAAASPGRSARLVIPRADHSAVGCSSARVRQPKEGLIADCDGPQELIKPSESYAEGDASRQPEQEARDHRSRLRGEHPGRAEDLDPLICCRLGERRWVAVPPGERELGTGRRLAGGAQELLEPCG